MAVEAKIGRASTLLKHAAALIPLLPGVALLIGVVDIPATADQLVSALSLTAGVVVIFLVMNLHGRIARFRTGRFLVMMTLLAIFGVSLAVAYVNFTESHVQAVETKAAKELILIPMAPSEELLQLVEPFDGDYREATMSPIVGPKVEWLIEAENDRTLAVLVSLLLAAQACLTFALMALVWRLVETG